MYDIIYERSQIFNPAGKIPPPGWPGPGQAALDEPPISRYHGGEPDAAPELTAAPAKGGGP